MVQSHDQEFSQATEIGKANQRLWPRVKCWCRHIGAEMTSYGMLAQATGLPIGQLRVICPHGHSTTEAMQLEWVASTFIRENCIGCPHHDEISPDNFGREVIATKQQQEVEAKEAEHRRKQLKAQAYEAAARALQSGKPTEESVNRFILDLFGSDEEAARSKDLLLQAAELGPECFSHASLRVMADAFRGPHATACIEATRTISRRTKSISDDVLRAALQAVEDGNGAACGLLCDAINHGQQVQQIFLALPSIVALPAHERLIGVVYRRPTYPFAVDLLARLLTLDGDAVRDAFAGRLKSPWKLGRYNAIEFLADLLSGQAPFVLSLTAQLLRAIELPDDVYDGASADEAASRLLAHLYAYSPEEVEDRIEEFLPGASEEVKVLILDVYSKLALLGIDNERSRWAEYRGFLGFDPSLYTRHAALAIDRLFQGMGDLTHTMEHRVNLCKELKRVVECYPVEGLARIDRLLGRLRMTVSEARNIPVPAPGPLAAIESYSGKIVYSALKRILTEILEVLAKTNPSHVFPQFAISSIDFAVMTMQKPT